MKVLDGQVDTQSASYQENFEQMMKINEELDKRSKEVMDVDPKYKALAKKRDKLLPRERINAIVDPGTAFLELSQMAGYKLYGKNQETVPSGNLITGVGVINGRQCMIIANNHSYRAGAYYPITVKKHVRAQEIAEENNLPCIYMVDSAGAFLPMQDDVFPDKNHFGRIFFNQARMSAKRIP